MSSRRTVRRTRWKPCPPRRPPASGYQDTQGEVTRMGKVVASASMSLDGFIAKADNTIGHLFDWLNSGDVEFPTINPDITFHVNQTSFDYMQGWVSSLGALVC